MIILTPKDTVKAKRSDSFFRDAREHRKRNMFRDLQAVDWTNIMHDDLSVDEMTDKLYETIWPKFDASFPLIKV